MVKFYIGNVRDKQSVDIAMGGVDYVFSAAALKQVPSCEFFPVEAVRTNILGTNNVLLSAIEHGVSNVVVLSTDKAALSVAVPSKCARSSYTASTSSQLVLYQS